MGDTKMKVSVHRDNSGALVLSKTFAPQFTPHSKYYATNNIWFCGYIVKSIIKLLNIDTVEQLGGFFIKGLMRNMFEYLRKKIMVWKISQNDKNPSSRGGVEIEFLVGYKKIPFRNIYQLGLSVDTFNISF